MCTRIVASGALLAKATIRLNAARPQSCPLLLQLPNWRQTSTDDRAARLRRGRRRSRGPAERHAVEPAAQPCARFAWWPQAPMRRHRVRRPAPGAVPRPMPPLNRPSFRPKRMGAASNGPPRSRAAGPMAPARSAARGSLSRVAVGKKPQRRFCQKCERWAGVDWQCQGCGLLMQANADANLGPTGHGADEGLPVGPRRNAWCTAVLPPPRNQHQ